MMWRGSGNVDRARRSEAVAALGALRTAARIWQVENTGNPTKAQAMAAAGMVDTDLNGQSYNNVNYTFAADVITATGTPGTVTINITTGTVDGA